MISVEAYLLFVAPFLMGLAGLMIYLIGVREARRDPSHSTPAE